MSQNSKILQKLLNIFTLIIQKNPDLAYQQHIKVGGKEVEN